MRLGGHGCGGQRKSNLCRPPDCLQICPLLMDLMTSMDRIQSLPPNYGPREKIKVSKRGSTLTCLTRLWEQGPQSAGSGPAPTP